MRKARGGKKISLGAIPLWCSTPILFRQRCHWRNENYVFRETSNPPPKIAHTPKTTRRNSIQLSCRRRSSHRTYREQPLRACLPAQLYGRLRRSVLRICYVCVRMRSRRRSRSHMNAPNPLTKNLCMPFLRLSACAPATTEDIYLS